MLALGVVKVPEADDIRAPAVSGQQRVTVLAPVKAAKVILTISLAQGVLRLCYALVIDLDRLFGDGGESIGIKRVELYSKDTLVAILDLMLIGPRRANITQEQAIHRGGKQVCAT